MRFWDSSALLPLLVEEKASAKAVALLESDPGMLVWWGTRVECISALSRLERDLPPGAPRLDHALESLDALSKSWSEVEPTDLLRQTACRLLRVHPLRASDALQLAALVVAADHDPGRLELVCLDARLAQAAKKEGFAVIWGS